MKNGKNTVEYQAIKENFDFVVDNILLNLQRVANSLFAKSLIFQSELEKVCSGNAADHSNATSMLAVILSKVEADRNNLHTFIAVLRYCDMKDCADRIVNAINVPSEPDSSTDCSHKKVDMASTSEVEDEYVPVTQSDEIPTGVRDSLASRKRRVDSSSQPLPMESSKSSKYSSSNANVSDSAYSGEELLSNTSGDNSFFTVPPIQQSDGTTGPGSEHVDTPGNNSTALVSGLDRRYFFQDKIAELEKQVKQHVAEIEYYKTRDSQKSEQLSQLNKDLRRESSDREKVVQEKDAIIKVLEINQNQKDQLIGDLRSEKAEIEGRFDELKKEHSEAVNSKKIAEERLAAVEKEFREKEEELNRQLEELKEKEERAVLELQVIKTELAEAKCARLEEVQVLKDKNHQLEKTEMELRFEIKVQDVTKDRELDKKQVELLETKNKLAESKLKYTEMLLEAAKLESLHSDK